jgi:hypothetical protein
MHFSLGDALAALICATLLMPSIAGAASTPTPTTVDSPPANPAVVIADHTATLLPSGDIVFIGGENQSDKNSSPAELYEPSQAARTR